MDLKKISANQSTVEVEWKGQTATVVYKPGELTVETIEELRSDEANDDSPGGNDRLLSLLAKFIKSWDITDGTKKIPTTAAGMRHVPLPLLRLIFRAIMEDARSTGEV